MPEPGIRIVVVDDHLLFREGIREILNVQPDFVVVGEAGESGRAVELVAEKKPDVVLLDVEIPGAHVTWTVKRIKEVSPRTAVVILSMFDGPRLIQDLIALDVSGYLLKSVSRHELVAITRMASTSLDRVVLSISRDSLKQFSVGEPEPAAGLEALLSEREREVLRLAADALSNAQIASRLGLSEATVKRHLRNVFTKLRAISRIDAVNRAVAAGVIAAPSAQAPAGHQ